MTQRRLWQVARRPLALSVLAGLYGAALGLAGWAGYVGGTYDHPTLVRAWAPSASAATTAPESGKGGSTIAAAPVASPAPVPGPSTPAPPDAAPPAGETPPVTPPPVTPPPATPVPAPPATTQAPPATTPPPSSETHATPRPAPAATPTPAPKKQGPSGPPELFQGQGKSDAGKNGAAKKSAASDKQATPAGRGDS